jgi:hypothetical protein
MSRTALNGTRTTGPTGITGTTPGRGRVFAASGAPMPGRRYRFRSPCTSIFGRRLEVA